MSDFARIIDKVDEHGGPAALGAALLSGGVLTAVVWLVLPMFGRQLEAVPALAIWSTAAGVVLVVSAHVKRKRAKKPADIAKGAIRMLTPPQIEMLWTMLNSRSGKLLLRLSNSDAKALRDMSLIYVPSDMTYVPPDGYDHFINPTVRQLLMENKEAVKAVYEEIAGEDLEARPRYADPRL